MSTILAEPPVVEPGRLQPRVQSQPRVPKPATLANAVPLREQVGRLVREVGLDNFDMFVFIAVYVFVVSIVTLMCFAARLGHAQAWVWGQHLMNIPLALTGIGLLAVATVAAGVALRFARSPSRWPTASMLGIATLCLLGFVATLAIDLNAKWSYGMRPGDQFRPNDRYVARRFGVKLSKTAPIETSRVPIPAAAPVVRAVSATNGRKLFLGTCASCHGPDGHGLPGQGKSLVANEFVGKLDDAKLLDFVKVGRQPWDALNTTKVQMPPRGGNPMLSDDDLRDAVAFLRTLQTGTPARTEPASAAAQLSGQSATGASPAVTASVGDEIDPALLTPRWVVSPPPPGPAGLSPDYVAELSRPEWRAPRDGVTFANTYFIAAQFGGLHAAAVTLLLAVLFVSALRGRVTGDRRALLALGVAGCVGMALAWCLLLPIVFVA